MRRQFACRCLCRVWPLHKETCSLLSLLPVAIASAMICPLSHSLCRLSTCPMSPLPRTPAICRSLPVVVRGHCKRGSLPIIALAVCGLHNCSNLPILVHVVHANYLPNVALATPTVDLPVIALAAHASNALSFPAAGRTLALIASC